MTQHHHNLATLAQAGAGKPTTPTEAAVASSDSDNDHTAKLVSVVSSEQQPGRGLLTCPFPGHPDHQLLLAVVLAWVGWWDELFSWFGHLRIHLTLGAYFWFSTLMFLAWAVTVFGLDRLSYWEFTPGQLTHKSLYGAGSKSYNAQGMGLEKHRDDLFRHWLLGLGSGDLKISTSGATREQIEVPNVLFIGSKPALAGASDGGFRWRLRW